MMLSQADQPARAPHPGAPRADRPARGRPAAGSASSRTGRPARTCSPTGRPSGPSAWPQTPWPRMIPDGLPSEILTRICDDLLEASIPDQFKDASTSLAVDWTDVETFSRPAVPRQPRLRRPRGLLGAPLRRRPRPGQRAVLRLLRLGRHHDARGARPARPRAGPPDDRVLLPRRPGPRPGPGADRDARRRHPARRHPGRLRLRPPRRPRLGRPAARCRRPAGPGPAPLRPRTPRHPRRRHHRQRQPVLPDDTPHPAGTRAARPRRHPRAGRRARPQTAELARYKLGRITRDDDDGYHRVTCPAAMGKIRCPLRPPR